MDLRKVVNTGLKSLIGKTHEIALPVVGKARVTCVDIGDFDLELKPNELHLQVTSKLTFDITNKILLPSFYGTTQISSVIGFATTDEANFEFKEITINWLDGPYRDKTNRVPVLLRKFISSLTKGNFLTDFINKKVAGFFSAGEIKIPREVFTPGHMLAVGPLFLHSMHSELVNVRLMEDLIEIELVTDIQGRPIDTQEMAGPYTFRLSSASKKGYLSRIYIEEASFNRVLSWSLRKNPEFFSGYVNSLQVAFKNGALQVDMIPSHLNSWIYFHLEMSFNPESKQWVLHRVDMSPDEKAGFCLRTLLGWLTDRIESLIENHFPLTEVDVLRGIMKLLNSINSEEQRLFEFSIRNFSLESGHLLPQNFEIEFQGQIDLTLRSNHLREIKDPEI